MIPIYNPITTPEMQVLARQPVSHSWFGVGTIPVILEIEYFTEQKNFSMLLTAFALQQLLLLRPHLEKKHNDWGGTYYYRTNEIGASDDEELCPEPDILIFGDANIFARFLLFR